MKRARDHVIHKKITMVKRSETPQNDSYGVTKIMSLKKFPKLHVENIQTEVHYNIVTCYRFFKHVLYESMDESKIR